MTTSVEHNRDGRTSRITFRSDSGIHILSHSTRQQLADVISEVEARTDCSVVVFEAEGRTFCAGADIKELRALTVETAERLSRDVHALFMRIEELDPVTIAAIHGVSAGGGTELALACDFRMATATTRIGLPEVSLGILPGWGGTTRAVALFGPAVAKRLILTGQLLSAQTAFQLGIVDTVVPDDAFRKAVEERIEHILACGPLALTRAKRLIHELARSTHETLFAKESHEFAQCFDTNEPLEGMTAFLDKRRPNWTDEPQ